MQQPISFPSGFLWGAATSAHQVEGNNRNNDWWQSEARGRVPHASQDACDSWHRWNEDVGLLARLGLNAYRLSIEWSRVEPEMGRFNYPVLDHYRRQIESLRQHGIEPLVTLHHFTDPLWLAERGGWTAADTADRFATYVDRTAEVLGDLVNWWITINEPTVASLFGYLTGDWPPHRRADIGGYLRHQRHTVRGHATARKALKARNPAAQVSMAFHLNPFEPLRRYHAADWLASRVWDWLWQGRVLMAAANHLDWVGLNYYYRVYIQGHHNPWQAFHFPQVGREHRTDYGWEIHPEGLYKTLKRVGLLNKPVIVTENGTADATDSHRARFIVEHLRWAHRAIQEGVDLRGYMHWSLLDNFEWAEGYTKRFGLVHVDHSSPSKTRTPRPSAWLYRDIARANGISGEVLAPHAHRLGQAPLSAAA